MIACSECGHLHFDPSLTGPGHPGGDYVPCDVDECTCPYKNPNPYRHNLAERQHTSRIFAQLTLDQIETEAVLIAELLEPLSIEALQAVRDRLTDAAETLTDLRKDITNKEV